jgi:hypothetical protein
VKRERERVRERGEKEGERKICVVCRWWYVVN